MKIIKLISMVLILSSVSAEKVTEIRYEGQKRINTRTIASNFPIKVGDDIDDDDKNEALKSLYKTGLFEDIKLKMDNTTLIVKVKEAPIIEKVSFEGNKKLKDEDIQKYIKFKPRETFSLTKIKNIQIGLLEMYRQSGMYDVSVSPKIIKLPNNMVNLVFEIDETKPTKIYKILFKGNKKISTTELRRITLSKPKRWFRFMAQDDIYSSERLKLDKESIENYYKNNGFAQAEVTDTTVELDSNGFIITFTIDEGEIYKFGNIKVNSNVKRLNAKDIKQKMRCKKGSTFDYKLLLSDNSALLSNVVRKGYAAVEVNPNFVPNFKNKTIDVEFNIDETRKEYISKVVIKGNNKTRDYVILKELTFSEGDIYNKNLVDQAEANLKSTGLFKNVIIEKLPDPYVPDKCIVEITVEEQKTAQISGSVSYSSQDGLSANAAYGETNFLGTGKGLNLSFSAGRSLIGSRYGLNDRGESIKKDRLVKFQPLNANASITVPHVFGTDISSTTSLFYTYSSPVDVCSTKNYGASVDLSYSLGGNLIQSWECSFVRKKVVDVSPLTSPYIKAQLIKEKDGAFNPADQLKYNQPSLRHTISFSKFLYKGIKGSYNLKLSSELYHNTHIKSTALKNILTASYVRPIGRSLSIKLNGAFGWFNDISGKGISIIDAFHTSQSTFRGLDAGSAAPKILTVRTLSTKSKISDNKDDNEIYKPYLDNAGARNFIKFSGELIFPLPFLPVELEAKLSPFVECGYFWNIAGLSKQYINMTNGKTVKTKINNKEVEVPAASCDYEKNEAIIKDTKFVGHKIIDDKAFRVTIGLGLAITTPFGPLKVSFGHAVKMSPFDERNRWVFGFSTTL